MPSPDLSDPLSVAVEITAIKGSLKLLQEQISTGLRNIVKTIDAIQLEQRQTTSIMNEVSRHQQSMEATSQGLNRAFLAIERLTSEFSGWRQAHEEANDETSEAVTGFKGALKGLGVAMAITSVLFGAVLALGLYSYQRDLTQVTTSILRLEQKHDKDTTALQAKIERNEKLREVR